MEAIHQAPIQAKAENDSVGEHASNTLAPPSFSLTAGPIQAKAEEGVMQRAKGDLETQMKALAHQCPVVNDAYMQVIHDASDAERQAVLNNKTHMDNIKLNIGGDSATLVINALMVGSQEWVNPTGNDFFEHFVTNKKDSPLQNTSSMNCWESILYSAFLAGQINGDYIRNFYGQALKASDPTQMIWKQLGFNTSLAKYPATTPTAGQFIFYLPKGAPYPSHIALSHGGDSAVSLWNQPNNVDEVQKIKINDLVSSGTEVYIGNSAW